MRHPLPGVALFFVLLSVDSMANGATVSSSSIAPAQVTEMTQAGALGVSTLTVFHNAKAEEAKALIVALGAQIAILRDVSAQLRVTLAQLEAKTDKRSSRQQKIQALRDKLAALDLTMDALEALRAEAAARFDAAMAAANSALATAIVASQSLIAEATGSVIAAQVAEIDKLIEAIRKLTEKIESIQKKMEALRPQLVSAVAQKEDANKAINWFSRISADPAQAARVLAAVLSNINNAPALGQFLNNDAPGSNIDVREVRELAGVFFVFRLGRLTHCVSPKLQCGGRSYTLTP